MVLWVVESVLLLLYLLLLLGLTGLKEKATSGGSGEAMARDGTKEKGYE